MRSGDPSSTTVISEAKNPDAKKRSEARSDRFFRSVSGYDYLEAEDLATVVALHASFTLHTYGSPHLSASVPYPP